jgi:hypothetical protein
MTPLEATMLFDQDLPRVAEGFAPRQQTVAAT